MEVKLNAFKNWDVDKETLYQGISSNYLDIYFDFIKNNLKSAIDKERREDLTPNEEFALAYSAGVGVDNFTEGDVMKYRTEPCGIFKDGDKWVTLTHNDGWITK
jgi:hypothetical protein